MEPRNERPLCMNKFIVSKHFIESICLRIYDGIKPSRKAIVELVFVGTLQWLESVVEQFQTQGRY